MQDILQKVAEADGAPTPPPSKTDTVRTPRSPIDRSPSNRAPRGPRKGMMASILSTGLAAAIFVGLSLRTPPAPAAIEIAEITGQAAITMGAEDVAAEPRTPTPSPETNVVFGPDGVIGITVRFKVQQPAENGVARLMAFVERDSRLVRIDEAHVTQRQQSDTWGSLRLRIPVRSALGAEPGFRRLWFASSYALDESDLDGRPIADVETDDDVAWVVQRIEVDD